MKTGFACGVFDLFHAGHALMLKECKQHCDFLIVALNKADNLPAGKNKPVFSIEHRKTIMESCRYVDKVMVYNSEEELLEILKNNKIDIRFLGDDYKVKTITGKDLNIKIHYTSRDHGFSTTSFIKQIIRKYS